MQTAGGTAGGGKAGRPKDMAASGGIKNGSSSRQELNASSWRWKRIRARETQAEGLVAASGNGGSLGMMARGPAKP